MFGCSPGASGKEVSWQNKERGLTQENPCPAACTHPLPAWPQQQKTIPWSPSEAAEFLLSHTQHTHPHQSHSGGLRTKLQEPTIESKAGAHSLADALPQAPGGLSL